MGATPMSLHRTRSSGGEACSLNSFGRPSSCEALSKAAIKPNDAHPKERKVDLIPHESNLPQWSLENRGVHPGTRQRMKPDLCRRLGLEVERRREITAILEQFDAGE